MTATTFVLILIWQSYGYSRAGDRQVLNTPVQITGFSSAEACEEAGELALKGGEGEATAAPIAYRCIPVR